VSASGRAIPLETKQLNYAWTKGEVLGTQYIIAIQVCPKKAVVATAEVDTPCKPCSS